MPDQKRPTAHVSISFSDSASADGSSVSAELSLDSEKNLLVYGQDKNTFKSGEAAYLKLHCSDPGYMLHCSAGSINKNAVGIAYPYSEDLDFRLSQSESLGHVPSGIVVHQWIGKDGGVPLFAGEKVSIPEPRTVVLNCEYKALGDRLKLVVTHMDMDAHESMDVLVVVSVNGKSVASTNVTYESGTVFPVPVELVVSDFCSDVEIQGVEVFLDGFSVGHTNLDGKISLGMLIPGSQHTLKMIKAGFVDSDLDVLLNDTFTVPDET